MLGLMYIKITFSILACIEYSLFYYDWYFSYNINNVYFPYSNTCNYMYFSNIVIHFLIYLKITTQIDSTNPSKQAYTYYPISH